MTTTLDTRSPVIFIVGSTAVGKTAAAMALAATRAVEIVNADSRQVYKGMSIGTAKPFESDRREVPHHLIDVADPTEGYSLSTFLSQARTAIMQIIGTGALPVVVGGTGQYVWGLVDGWLIPEVAPDTELRARLEKEAAETGTIALHARLEAVDADAASSIDPRNVRRVIRALEVWEATGVESSARPRQGEPPFRPIIIGLTMPREQIYRRIDERVDTMIEMGWVEEVRTLIGAGCTSDLPAFTSAGYRELASYLNGDLSLPQATAKTKISTHRLARKQASWFRPSYERITWTKRAKAVIKAVDAATG
jgi:tRNA dimethylallyltransferase